MPSFSGHCLCGNVRYSVAGEVGGAAVCHCRDCQRHSGSAFATVAFVPKSAISVEGPIRTFRCTGDSGRWLERQFCPECGSSVLMEAEVQPGVALIQVGTMDDARAVKPGIHIFCDRAHPWVPIPGDVQKFPRMLA